MTSTKNWQAPLRLTPAFTPSTRTPWGGTRIAARYGTELGLAPGSRVGEAWSLSLDPAFPSRVQGAPLASLLESTLLVKLLDAAEPLSVQIHPSDHYAGLRPGESGKPEAWYVFERAPGAGLYLGFRPGVDEEQVRAALVAGGDLSRLMHFVEVDPGDVFVIHAGTPHAIGPGVMLVEPQRVLPGWSGVTYRYWDWGRRYDATGQPSPSGILRDIHIEHALAVTDWERVTDPGFVDTIRRRCGEPRADAAACLELLAAEGGSGGTEGALASDDLRIARLSGTGECHLPSWQDWGALGVTVVEGEVRFADGQVAGRGETIALAAGPCGSDVPVSVELHGAHALVMAARPS